MFHLQTNNLYLNNKQTKCSLALKHCNITRSQATLFIGGRILLGLLDLTNECQFLRDLSLLQIPQSPPLKKCSCFLLLGLRPHYQTPVQLQHCLQVMYFACCSL